MHKVKKGETLAAIAKKYGLEAEELKEINELKGSKLKAGQMIRLRLEEEDGDLRAEKNEPNKALAEEQEAPLVFVQGNGFLWGKRAGSFLGRVARSFLGFRYTKGGGSINGMDCSSYVQRVYKIFGIDLPRTAREQFGMGYAVAKSALQVGDLVFFKRPKSREPTHVGIYLGDNQYIHTSQTKRQVDIDSLDGRYANLHFVGAKRIEEVEAKKTRRDSKGSNNNRPVSWSPRFPFIIYYPHSDPPRRAEGLQWTWGRELFLPLSMTGRGILFLSIRPVQGPDNAWQPRRIDLPSEKRHAAVIGGGVMGADIAVVFASGGWSVHIVEPSERTREALPERIKSGLEKLKAKGEGGFSIASRMEEIPWEEIEIAVEAVPEKLEIKQEVFARMEGLSRAGIPLTSNSSGFPISEIGKGLKTRSRMLGLHFFMPAHLAPLVEVVCSEATDPRLAEDVCVP